MYNINPHILLVRYLTFKDKIKTNIKHNKMINILNKKRIQIDENLNNYLYDNKKGKDSYVNLLDVFDKVNQLNKDGKTKYLYTMLSFSLAKLSISFSKIELLTIFGEKLFNFYITDNILQEVETKLYLV